MKKNVWMLLLAAICGTSSLVTANECSGCETSVAVTVPEEKKDETNPVVANGETPVAPEAPVSQSN
ncbi:MAG: hypothetical protein LVR00_08675 [Rhabdochlamydiaceae bacterium]